MYLINTKISSFHMLISHWDFLVFELGVHVFPFLCCLSYSHWFYEFLDSFWIIPFISYKSCEKNLDGTLGFYFFKMFDEKKFFSGVEFISPFHHDLNILYLVWEILPHFMIISIQFLLEVLKLYLGIYAFQWVRTDFLYILE